MSDADKTLKRKTSKSEAFGKFLHNSENGTYCGTRDATAWRKLLCFYFIYYSALVCFWAICFAVMVSVLPEKEDGPLVHRGSVESEIHAYAHILTGNPRLFPMSQNDDPLKESNQEYITFCNSSGCLNNALNGPSGIDTMFRTYGTCEAEAKQVFQNACGDASYGYKSTTGTGPCVFVKMARTWNFPVHFWQGAIECGFNSNTVNFTAMPVIAYQFAPDENAGTCSSTAIGGFEPNPFTGDFGTYRTPVVAFKLATALGFQYGVTHTMSCNMQHVDQGFLVGPDGRSYVTVF